MRGVDGMRQSHEIHLMKSPLQTIQPIKVHSYDSLYQIVDILPPSRCVQCRFRRCWWIKRGIEPNYTNIPQWDTLTVGERVSHGEVQYFDSENGT